MKKPKLSLIGVGNIGGTIACLAANNKYIDVTLYDINGNIAKGKALDILQMNSVSGSQTDCELHGTNDISEISDSDVIIITAGLCRKVGETREDLIAKNSSIISSIAESVKKYSPDAFVIIVTNPVDIMTHVFQKISQFPYNRVIGMGGVLDAARFAYFLAEEFKVSRADVTAMVIGAHGETMVPLVSASKISGISIEEMLKAGHSSEDNIKRIVSRTKTGGAEIGSLLGVGTAFYAPAKSAFEMAIAFLNDSKKIHPCVVHLSGEYEVEDLYIGVPTVLGSNGAESIIELNLNADENKMFHNAVSSIKDLIKLV